jgi:hypothetical protein
VKAVRITAGEIERAKAAALDAGLRLVGLEKRPDGTLRFEFAEAVGADDWRDGSPLYDGRTQ